MATEHDSGRLSDVLRALWRDGGYHPGRTMSSVLCDSAKRYADTRVVFSFDGQSAEATVGRLHEQAHRLASALRSMGVGPGDVVAVQLPNRIEMAVTYQAVLLAGAVLLPIVHVYGPREVEFILRESGAKVFVMPDRYRHTDYRDRLPMLRAIETLEHVVLVAEVAEPGTTSWRALAAGGDSSPPPRSQSDEVCLLVYTSGTTAAPKGVQHTHESVLAEVATQPRMLAAGPEAVQLASFPSGHVAGTLGLLRLLVLGTPTVFMDGWDAPTAIDLIAKYGVSTTSGTPFHLSTLLDAVESGAALGTLRQFLVGAATVPAELVARADRAGIVAFRSYGSTEHPTISSGTPEDPLAKRQYTDGRPGPGTEVRVVGPDGGDVGLGEDGEIVCRGPEQFVGYRNVALDPDTWTSDGWLRTGDIGRLDAEGYLTVTDRAKDVIIRGGETISSREVEDVLLGCPGVVDAAAIAVPDPRYGEKVGAVVVLEVGVTLNLETVRTHFTAAGAARQKTPEVLEIVEELPRSPIGKVRKDRLRRRYTEKSS